MNEYHSAILNVNGEERIVSVEPRDTLLDALRNSLDITGPKKGCDEAACGACAVLVDGKAICSCTMLAVEAVGSKIVTIEGLSNSDTKDPLQMAFVLHDSLQCGFCTSGQIIAARSYLNELSGDPGTEREIKEALSGNLCRCGSYNKIVEAIADFANRVSEV